MSALNMRERPLSPPAMDWESEAEERSHEERRQIAYIAAMAEAMRGAGPFWNGEWDDEQEWAIFAAVRNAVSGIGLNDIERWNILLRAVLVAAGKMASSKAEEAK